MKKLFINGKRNKILIICIGLIVAISTCCIALTLGSVCKIDQFANAQEVDDAVELVYQEQAELQVGDTQNVAVTFSNAKDAPQSKVVYRKVDSESQLVLDVDKVEDNIAYYKAELVDDSYVGTYIFDKIVWNNNDNGYKKTINDDSYFLGQFNCTYASESDEDLPAGIYSIGEDGQISIISTLDNTSDKNVMAMTADAMASLGKIDQNGAVVALDPGHGGNDPGACSGGLQEKNLNWSIAMSCKSELEQYGGVSVYVTRGENECPGLRDRVERARSAGACIFVSLHNNSGGGSGAEVWVQHAGGWASGTHDRGVDIANRALSKICGNLGLGNRGVKERYCTDGSAYPDGTLGDYYSVLYWSRMYSIPGIIIEHAFVDGDNGFLSNGNNLYWLGVYDAQAIAESYGWQKGTSGGENIVGTYNIEMSASSNAVMDVAGSSTAESANVQIGTKTSEGTASESQKWRVVTDKDGWAVLWNVNSGKVLDVVGGSSTPKTNVQQATFNNTDAQKFSFHKQANGFYHIQSKVGNRQVLDVDDGKTAAGTNIKIFTESDASAQCFKLSKVAQPESGSTYNGKFTIKYAGGNNQVLDIAGGSKDNGANVDIYAANSTNAQKFIVSTEMDGYATIKNVGSGKVLDIENGWTYPCSNVQQYESNGTNAQKFKIVENDDGTVTFVPKCNENIALDVSEGHAKSGTNVWAYYLTFATSQKWVLEDLEDPLPESTATFGDYFYQVSPNSTGASAYGIEIAGASKSNGAIADMSIFSMDNQNKVFALFKNGDYYYIVNINSWKALDCGGSSTSAGQQVHQWDLEYGNSNQMWGAYAQEDGSVKFICRGNKKVLSCASETVSQGTRVVTVDEALQVDAETDLGGAPNTGATTWNLTKATFNPQNINGEFYVSSALNYGKVLDVAAGSKDDGANVQIYDINRSGAQKWKITTAKLDPSDPESIYASTITNAGSGKVLDVSGGNFTSGANVWQYAKNDSYAQKWLICDYNGKYIIRSLGNPYCVLDISCGSTENGANVQIYSANHSEAQQWELTDTSVVVPECTAEIADGKYSISSDVSTTRGLNVTGNTYAVGARVKLGKINDNIGSCAFNIKKSGNYYHITNAESGNALAVSGVDIVTATSKSSDNMQLWSAVEKGESIQFVNVATGLYLNVEKGLDKEGQNINVYKATSTAAQLWTLNALESPVGEQINGSFYISMSKNYNQVAEVAGGSLNNGANIQIYNSNGSGAQKWNITTDSSGIATIKNVQSGKVFDIAGGFLTSGSNVWQYTSNATNAQKFKFVKDGEGYRIYSAVNDYLCIDVVGGSTNNGANVQMYSANGSDAQKFELFNVNPAAPTGPQVQIENKTFKIATKLNNGYVVDIAGGSSTNGANIQLYSFNSSGAQIFWVEKDSGYYRFVNAANTNKCIDVDGGKVLPGTNVQLWDKSAGNPNQLFAAFDGGNESIVFQNVASGLILDLTYGTVALGQNIQGYKYNGGDAQKWVLTETPYVPPVTGVTIMGAPTCDAGQMARYYCATVGAGTYPAYYRDNPNLGATSIEAFAQICYEEGVSEGVNPAVMFGQMIHETGWLRFGGSVKVEQCNFGGLGATSTTTGGAWFPDIRTGIRAQIQHLKAYGSTADLVNPCVDPRFNLVTRGCAPLVTDLNGKWAVPGVGYGEAIISHMNKMRNY